ncbi:MAG: fused MFS/spermidine synthase [Planctomycetes bacterium]|nr:fused MFS/spermidine synthase [Planctomycetota bacterium]
MGRNKPKKQKHEPGQEKPKPAATAVGPAAAKPANQLGLKVLVLTAGAVLMGLEIVGSRLLAPHFGNSVFVWGSLISVFLTALSAGYYAGGYLADRKPSFVLLNGLCILVAALILVVPWKGHDLCRSLVSSGFEEETGPLVAAAILFLPASLILGMVSPFSVRLSAPSVESVGRSAGTLYALSTLGSIAGTLVTTFVLIPKLGVARIFQGLGGTMLVVPGALLVLRRRPEPLAVAAILVGVWGLTLPFSPAAVVDPGRFKVRLDEDTPYHHISVLDARRKGSRDLRFDFFKESSIELAPPYRSLSRYTNYFHLAFLARPRIASTLFIGAGGGVGPRSFWQMDPGMKIDVVDVDSRILDIAREYFFLPEEDSIRTFARDGRMFVQFEEGTYDCIILDAFTIGGRIPFHLVTRECFELYRERLSSGGVFVINTNSSLSGEKSEIFRSVLRTMQAVFPQVHVFAVDYQRIKSEDSRNIILVAEDGAEDLTADEWRKRIADYPEGKSYITREFLRGMVEDLVSPSPEVGDAVLLSDDFAPIETMGF